MKQGHRSHFSRSSKETESVPWLWRRVPSRRPTRFLSLVFNQSLFTLSAVSFDCFEQNKENSIQHQGEGTYLHYVACNKDRSTQLSGNALPLTSYVADHAEQPPWRFLLAECGSLHESQVSRKDQSWSWSSSEWTTLKKKMSFIHQLAVIIYSLTLTTLSTRSVTIFRTILCHSGIISSGQSVWIMDSHIYKEIN